MKVSVSTLAIATLLAVGGAAVAQGQANVATPGRAPTATASQGPATVAQADAFVAAAEKELAEFSVRNAQAQWVNSTYITEDTDALAA